MIVVLQPNFVYARRAHASAMQDEQLEHYMPFNRPRCRRAVALSADGHPQTHSTELRGSCAGRTKAIRWVSRGGDTDGSLQPMPDSATPL